MVSLRLGLAAAPLSRSAVTTPLARSFFTSTLTLPPPPPPPQPTTFSRSSTSLFNYTIAFSLPFSFFGLFGGSGADSSSSSSVHDVTSKSSTLFREQNAFVGRKQATTLFFASVREQGRKDWQSWIGHFRNEGFDCIDANLDFEQKSNGDTSSSAGEGQGDGASAKTMGKADGGEDHKIFADELTSQIRLSSLQRSPLLFIHASSVSASSLPVLSSLGSSGPSPISILHAHLTTRPYISGLIIVERSAGEATKGQGAQGMLEEMKEKLGDRLLIVQDGEDGIREGQRWMVNKGF